MSRASFKQALEKAVDKAGSQRSLAASISVSQSHISEVLAGSADPSDTLLAALGWKRDAVYRRERKPSA